MTGVLWFKMTEDNSNNYLGWIWTEESGSKKTIRNTILKYRWDATQ